MTPDEALAILEEGNRAFLQDAPLRPQLDRESRLALAMGQQPFAAYVSCSDSRVPPELLFGRGLGELFIVRNAGNTLDTAAMGSLEFAVSVLGVPLIVVMGHEDCGAVKAAVSTVYHNVHFSGNIGKMIEPIIPAVLEVAHSNENCDLNDVVRHNVRRVVRELRTESAPILMQPQREGRLKIVGAYYNFHSGAVEFFDKP
jgi:carbonic anhydrase